MIRAIGILGLAAGFLALSPPLRFGALQTGIKLDFYLKSHSPYSYVSVGVAMLFLMVLLARSVRVKH